MVLFVDGQGNAKKNEKPSPEKKREGCHI